MPSKPGTCEGFLAPGLPGTFYIDMPKAAKQASLYKTFISRTQSSGNVANMPAA